ncbi:hypothetical protein [Conexibacter stalactiti]|uniref:hypothetical protein n=1 Tax=Conexibacter stalactiti TaxID=1940611 RepID=UPI00298CA721|nr:hypothetical protein [Conexibacter stalactiti]
MPTTLRHHSLQKLWAELRLVEALAEQPCGQPDRGTQAQQAIKRMRRVREIEILYRSLLTSELAARTPRRDG